jgi:type I restriction enzyme S subunit
MVFRDDLLVTIVGANTGDVCRVPEPVEEHYVCQSVALMRPVEPATGRFLDVYFNSPGEDSSILAATCTARDGRI